MSGWDWPTFLTTVIALGIPALITAYEAGLNRGRSERR